MDISDDNGTLSTFDPLECESKLFQTNGLIDGSGKIVDASAIPIFNPEYIIKWANGESYSYETLAFVFYFPDTAERHLKVGQKRCSEKDIIHKKSYCIKKQKCYTPQVASLD